MVRAVLDPGVLIAALLSPDGAPASLILACREGRFELIVSPKVLAELERVLLRPKFRRYVSAEEAREYGALLGRLATALADPTAETKVTPDPGDDYLVLLAQTADAVLVSGDAHLVELKTRPPHILTPRAFLAHLRKGQP